MGRRKSKARARVQTWVILAKSHVADDRLVAICHHPRVECSIQGHMSGVPYIKVRATESALAELLEASKQDIDFVEPDFTTRLIPQAPNEEGDEVAIKAVGRSAASWGLERIGVPHPTRSGSGVHVYVLDTGVRTTHEDFEGRAIPTLEFGLDPRTRKEYGRKCDPTDRRCAMDRNGHGTHCAGTVGGRRYGVAKDVTIHAVKVMGDDGTGSGSWVVSAMDWITRHAEKPAVMSMSLGGKGRSRMEQAAVNKAIDAGITVVVAAGNENDDACQYTPAFVQRAITVGATSSNDVRASYSNYGSCVQIFAPGTNIRSAGHLSDDSSKDETGTSMACPHVAGAAALLLGENPSLKPDQVTAKILRAATPNAIRGLRSRYSPNKLLSVSDADAPAPTPAPTSSSRKTCPSFAKRSYAYDDGDCECTGDATCWSQGTKGCPFAERGYLSARYFSADCRDCTCRSKTPDYSEQMVCNSNAVSRTPDAEGDCKCPSGTVCSTDGRYANCPYSGGVGGRTGQYFLHTCSASTCKCYRTRSWPFF